MGIERELLYQAQRAGKIRFQATRPATVERYRNNRHWRLYRSECVYRMLGDLRNKSLLDFGCGEGVDSVIYAALGAEVTGIDVSRELIGLARRRADLDGVPVRFLTGDILKMEPLGTYDVVVANAVLHHVDIRRVVPRLLQCVRPGGLIVVSEPVRPCGLIRVVRRLVPVPVDASSDEHPLTPGDLSFLRNSVPNHEIYYFDLLGRFGRLFQGSVLSVLLRIDRVVLSVSRGLAGSIVFVGQP
jgi:SAM-dependent methyltransferase